MKIANSNSILERIWIFLFLFISVFFPGDTLNLKIFFLLLALIGGVLSLVNCITNKKLTFILIMGTVYPVWLVIQSFFLTGNLSGAISSSYCPIIILLVIIAYYQRIPYKKYFITLLKALALLTVIIVFFDIVGVVNVNYGPIRSFVYKFDMGIMGKSQSYAAYYKIFFKASPLLIILIPYLFEKEKYLFLVITVLAIIFSGTRGNIFASFFVVLFELIFLVKKKKKATIILSFFLFLSLIPILIISLNLFYIMMNTDGSISSDAVRIGQISSFIEVFSNPRDLILGQGFGSLFFDSGRNTFTVSSEISYFDLLRKIGLISFIPFMILVLIPFNKIKNIHTRVAYFGYLLICFTNPLLFSSTAYLLYDYLYILIYSSEENNYLNLKALYPIK